jgi:2-polyprenyl-6-methoxyphenol hydroxylase-like FAD-dependent oxidoreductase
MSRDRPIAVIGAGVAGLAVARFLSRAGFDVAVFERFAQARPVGSGLLLQPTGLAVLERLGIRGQALALGSRIEQLVGKTAPTGRTIFDIQYASLSPDCHGLGMHRASLFHLLRQTVDEAGVPVHGNRTITSVRPDGEFAVLIDETGEEIGPFALVIDASGARSRLRQIVGARPPRPFRFGAVWGVARATRFARDALQQRYRGASIMVGVLPIGRLPDDTTPLDAFFWSIEANDLDQFAAGDIAAFRRRVADIWPETEPLLAQFERLDDLTPARYGQAMARPLSSGRLVLIGDAAHQTSPQLGQGANMALLDAAALADAVALHGPSLTAIETYRRARGAHVAFYQAASAALTPFFQSRSRTAAIIRDATFAPAAAIPWLRRQMLQTLTGTKSGLLSSRDPVLLANAIAMEKPVVASSSKSA